MTFEPITKPTPWSPAYLADPHCYQCGKPMDKAMLDAEQGQKWPYCPWCRVAFEAHLRVVAKRREARKRMNFWEDQQDKAENQGFVDVKEY